MTPKGVYSIYHGIKLHFVSKSYDYLTYGPSNKFAEAAFNKAYLFCAHLASKYQTKENLELAIVATFRKEKNPWINEVVTRGPADLLEMKKIWDDPNSQLIRDLNEVEKRYSPDWSDYEYLFKPSKKWQLPLICRAYISGVITIETLCIFDYLLGNFSLKLNDLIWKQHQIKVEKFKAFFHPDLTECAKSLRQVLEQKT